MKTIITALLLISLESFAQPDKSIITVNIRDNAKLNWNGTGAVKQKVVVKYYSPLWEGEKEIYIRGIVEKYVNNGGVYGAKITSLIGSDQTLSAEEKQQLLDTYGDKEIFYTTKNKYVLANGDRADSATAPGAIPEMQYWQSFKLNNASLGMTSASTQGALDAEYKIIVAIINRLNLRKNF